MDTFDTSIRRSTSRTRRRRRSKVFSIPIDEMEQDAADNEAQRLKAAGTRATNAVDTDTPFRERFVKMLCQCGIPLYKVTRCVRSLRVNAIDLSLILPI